MKSLVIVLAMICSVGLPAAEKKDGLLPLTVVEAFPKDQQAARSAVVAALTHEGLNPHEYYASVESRSAERALAFHLWHESALKHRGDPGIRGDPSGKCRTVLYDLERGKVTKIHGWK